MIIETIHSDRMKDHLIAQFADKPVIYAELDALGAELDLLRQAFTDLREKRWIDTGEGMQLNGIGTIVDRPRQIDNAIQVEFFGFQEQDNTQTFGIGRFRGDTETWLMSATVADDLYRRILWLKVYKDTARATADDIMHSVAAIFDVEHVTMQELGNAKIMLGIGARLLANNLHFLQAVNLFIRGGGVGIEAVEMYDYKQYFGFLGQPNAKTFGEGIFADLLDIMGVI